jgi:hypothetical protein
MRYKLMVVLALLALLSMGLVSGTGAQAPSMFVDFDGQGTLGELQIFHYNDNFLDQLPPVVQVGAGCTPGAATCAEFLNEGGVSFLRLALNGASGTGFEAGRYYVVDVRDDLYDGTTNFPLTAPEEGHCWLINHRARYYGYSSTTPNGTAGAWLWEYPFVNGVVEPANAVGTQWLSPAGIPQLNNLSGKFTEGLVIENIPTVVTPLTQLDITQWQTYRWEWCNRHGQGQSFTMMVDGHPGASHIVGNVNLNNILWEVWVDNQNGFQSMDFPVVDTGMDVDWVSASYE